MGTNSVQDKSTQRNRSKKSLKNKHQKQDLRLNESLILKCQKKQSFISYLSARLPKRNERQTKKPKIDKQQVVFYIQRKISSAQGRQSHKQKEAIQIRNETQEMIKTQVLVPKKQESFQIPGIRFKNESKNTSPQKITARQKWHSCSTHRKIQKMINVESIIQRKCKNFDELMREFYKRANINTAAKIFVFNSQDIWLKSVLLKRGWTQNPNKQSRAYHLNWSYKYPKVQPFSQQLVNHYMCSDVVTSKLRLHEALQSYKCSNLQPSTYDLSKQKQEFLIQFEKNKFCKDLTELLENIQFNFIPQCLSISQIEAQYYCLREKMQLQKANFQWLTLLDQCHNLMQGKIIQKCYSLFVEIKNQIRKVQKLSQNEQNILSLIKKMYSWMQNNGIINGQQKNIWILKSRSGSKGAGILLSNNLSQIERNQSKLVQKYIQNPLILKAAKRHKFDIRIWVLVTGSAQISIYYYQQFYGRICSEQYDLSQNQIKNSFIHLTNYSINKSKYGQKKDMEKSVILSSALFQNIEEEFGLDYRQSFYQKLEIILTKLRPIFENEVCRDAAENEFQLFGFDLLIDSSFELHLLQINLSARCQQRHQKLSEMLCNMGNGLLNIIQNKSEYKGWKQVHFNS